VPRAWRSVRRAAAQVYGPDGLGKLAKGGHPRRRLASAELLPEHERSAGAGGKESDRLAALRPASERRAAAERSAGRANAVPGGVELLRPFEALPAQGQGASGGALGAGGSAAGARRAGLREVGGLRGANEVALDMASIKGRGDSARGDAGRARLDAENPGKGGELRQGAGGRQQGAAVDASAVAGFTDARAASGGAGAAAEKGGAGFAGGGGAAGASAEAAACITDYNPVTPKEYQEVRAPAIGNPPVETLAREPDAAPRGRIAARLQGASWAHRESGERPPPLPPLRPMGRQGCRGAACSPRMAPAYPNPILTLS